MSADILSSKTKELLARDDISNFDLNKLPGDIQLGAAILDRFYVAPDVQVTRNGIRELNIPSGGFHIDQVSLHDRLGRFGSGLQYQIGIEEVGKFALPGAGKRRAYSLLAHKDIKANPHFMVWYPGFGHSLLAKSTKWEMAIQAEVAHALGVNILCVNPAGRGVPAVGSTRGVANIGATTMIEDAIHTTDSLIDALLVGAGVSNTEPVDIIVSGHSLGAAIARAYAHDIVMKKSRRVLRGLIQEAPVGAGTCEDLLEPQHFGAIKWQVPESILRAAFTSKGMQFKMYDAIRLFYGDDVTLRNAALAAWALVPGETRNFLDLSLLKGDLEQFVDTVSYPSDSLYTTVRGVGSQLIFPTRDQVFHRGPQGCKLPKDRMWRETYKLGTKVVTLDAPHCFVTPDPTTRERNEVRRMYRQVFGL